MKRNYLLEEVIRICSKLERGRILDLGCGDGDYSYRIQELGFQVVACDMDEQRFRYSNEIQFTRCDITQKLPFLDNTFDCVLLLEVIEHLKNPCSVIAEIRRVLNSNGKIIISTPNILNLKSRLRFLTEGAFEFFREPPLDQANNPREKIYNLHLCAYRFQELEYLLAQEGFNIQEISTSVYENRALSFFIPLIKLQLFLKQRRSLKKSGLDFTRINRIMLSKELLYGRHIIIKADKISDFDENKKR